VKLEMEKESRPDVTPPRFASLFVQLCLDRGWATPAQIAECLKTRKAACGEGSAPSLAVFLITEGVITVEQSETLRADVSRIVERGEYPKVRRSDAWIGQLLVEAGATSEERIREVLALQEDLGRRGGLVPRLGELLLERGYVSSDALRRALEKQSRLRRMLCPACGVRYACEEPESGKVVVCEGCANPLSMA
jgi:hypothetical protein